MIRKLANCHRLVAALEAGSNFLLGTFPLLRVIRGLTILLIIAFRLGPRYELEPTLLTIDRLLVSRQDYLPGFCRYVRIMYLQLGQQDLSLFCV